MKTNIKMHLGGFFIFSFVIFFFYFYFTGLNNSNDNVTFSIKPEYESYYLDSDLWLTFKLENNTKQQFIFRGGFSFPFIQLNITDPNGNQKRKIVNEMVMKDFIDTIILSPGKSILNNLPLDIYLGSEYLNVVGDYRIIASYNNLTSNSITVSVKNPEGIEKSVHEEMIGIYKTKANFSERSNKIEEILSNYPKTSYGIKLYNILFSGLFYTDKEATSVERLDNDIINFLNNYGDSFGTDRIISNYITCLNKVIGLSNQDIINKLEIIKKRYAGTNAENIIELNQKRYK